MAEYQVVVEHDGCHRGEVDHPNAEGSREACVRFVSNHLPPYGMEFGIRHNESGRLVSYLCEAPTCRRRVRLVTQDLREV